MTVATVATIAANPLQKLRMAADVSPARKTNAAVVTVPSTMLRLRSRFDDISSNHAR